MLGRYDRYDVEAGPVLGIPEVLENPQVKIRKMFEELDHPLLGKILYRGPLWWERSANGRDD